MNYVKSFSQNLEKKKILLYTVNNENCKIIFIFYSTILVFIMNCLALSVLIFKFVSVVDLLDVRIYFGDENKFNCGIQ